LKQTNTAHEKYLNEEVQCPNRSKTHTHTPKLAYQGLKLKVMLLHSATTWLNKSFYKINEKNIKPK
jgi:hypothetical protein